MATIAQPTAAGCTIKYKTTSGGSYAAITSVISFEPDTLMVGDIKLKRALQASSRWRKRKPGDPEAGKVKVTNIWDKTEYALVRGWADTRVDGLYFEMQIQDETTGSKWERIGFVTEVDEPKAVQGEDGGEEILWGFTISIDGEPTFTSGT
jgi:hypothetical protein